MAEEETIGLTRLEKELSDIQEIKLKLYKLEDAGKSNANKWLVSLFPDRWPYNVGGYKVEIEFTKEYPFKPPKIKFLTKVYHPNVNENGEVSLAMATKENWKPSIKIDQLLTALAELLCSPQLGCVLRPDLAELYIKDVDTYNKNALEFCKHYSEKQTQC
ncbi:ubiquitin-conjugating enzyme family protein [Loa loa]|uniref:Ubiquitin-conjugating enzyme family protein n=1 Tax=Loa loa TaxID=7209 RepID=A0A1S0TSJ7_LOALO|nr:ubiquitin-conjugating enzyme family protein [Loa loa]EFO19396.1 ubiquitin-conjugating enzyme family protein [Loa loa]